MLPEIQLDMLSTDELEGDVFAIMRKQRIIGQGGAKTMDIALARIEIEPYGDQWMWAVSINSKNGSESGYKPFPKWGKFALSRGGALEKAADELGELLYRLTGQERAQVIKWLGGILPYSKHQAN